MKFKAGQIVYVAFDGRIAKAKILSVVTNTQEEICESGAVVKSSRTYYKCHGTFIFKNGGKSYFSYHREFEDDVIFETEEQAKEYVVKNIDKTIKDFVVKATHLCSPFTRMTKKDVISINNYNIIKATRQFLREIRKKSI